MHVSDGIQLLQSYKKDVIKWLNKAFHFYTLIKRMNWIIEGNYFIVISLSRQHLNITSLKSYFGIILKYIIFLFNDVVDFNLTKIRFTDDALGNNLDSYLKRNDLNLTLQTKVVKYNKVICMPQPGRLEITQM